ncbi:MAG: DUF1064 domain-containing protein [Patescibacteria group bacterium]|nr:DUF1064 domain-containing protein [Patescibacteria group bacterium]
MAAPIRWPDKPGIRKSKFGAEPTMLDGIRFPSKGEAARYAKLQLAEKAGAISHLKRQPKFLLGTDDKPVLIRSDGFPNGRRAVYHADFEYVTDSGEHVVEEFKGKDTTASRLRRAVVEAQYGIRILVTRSAK